MHQSGGKTKPVLRPISPNFSIIHLFQILMGRFENISIWTSLFDFEIFWPYYFNAIFTEKQPMLYPVTGTAISQ